MALSLYQEIRESINRHSAESVSNTPDYILAQYMLACLSAYEAAIIQRDKWYKFEPNNPNGITLSS